MTFGLLRPAQAASVSDCIYDTYRLTYLHEDMYHPLRIAALNDSGEMISAVATAPDGTVVGHIALSFPDDERFVPEIGIAATRRDWRGRHVAHHLADLLMEEGAARGLYGVFGEAITVHTYSQHLNVEMGFGTCAVRLACHPGRPRVQGHRAARAAPQLGHHDVPLLRGARRTAARRARAAPRDDRAPLRVDRRAGPTGGVPRRGPRRRPRRRGHRDQRPPRPGLVHRHHDADGFGDDASARLHEELRRLRESEFRVVEALVDMARPGAAKAAGRLEELGFLFSGIRPAGPHKDWLLLQYFNGVLVDYDVMAVDSDESRELVAYVRAFDPDAG